ncbi:PEGA domain-containing protein [Thermatribacter velox]|uniref:PEGA domain-containing protein n=1 Tax=Thermatribacter velox TaxID=3039681 RepID=A0ABZ2YF77_9BACT
MKMLVSFLLSFLLLASFTSFGCSQEYPVIAVVGFENHSDIKTPDLGNMGLQYLENALLSMGRFTLADRLTVQKSLTEIGFSSVSGLVDPAYAIQLGKMLGARYLAMGDVIEVASKTTEFQGYGIKTRRSSFSVTVGLRIIDAERGLVLFADQCSLSREGLPLKSLGVTVEEESLNVVENLLREAVQNLVNRFDTRLAKQWQASTEAPKKVKIVVNSNPSGADVEVGGIFYGNTPCELLLNEDSVVEITVSLPGYTVWAKKVKVMPGLQIMATLREEPVESTSPSKVEVKVGIESQNSGGE